MNTAQPETQSSSTSFLHNVHICTEQRVNHGSCVVTWPNYTTLRHCITENGWFWGGRGPSFSFYTVHRRGGIPAPSGLQCRNLVLCYMHTVDGIIMLLEGTYRPRRSAKAVNASYWAAYRTWWLGMFYVKVTISHVLNLCGIRLSAFIPCDVLSKGCAPQ